ncbi:hypothetical protein HN51_058687, partial [Arachis hypogaea]
MSAQLWKRCAYLLKNSSAANYLIIPSLLELTTNALANSVQTKLDLPMVVDH